MAVKRGLAVAHLEAGLRSADRTIPEEINIGNNRAGEQRSISPARDRNRKRERSPNDG
ncbi:MAG: hypothetical protein IH905_11900 [Proteobacteria bacterium]|nr:hypothetical protein [Pseudomonadota bacterium]